MIKNNRRRIKVGMDIDGTLALTQEAIITEFNSRTRSRYTIEHMDTWVISADQKLPIPKDEFNKIYELLWTEKQHMIKPSIGEKPFSELLRACDVEIVTNRPERHQGHVEAWMNAHFPDTNLKINCVSSLEYKVHMGYDVLFDDANPVAEEMIRNGRNGTVLYLIEKPWNRKLDYGKRSSSIMPAKSLEHGINGLLSGLYL